MNQGKKRGELNEHHCLFVFFFIICCNKLLLLKKKSRHRSSSAIIHILIHQIRVHLPHNILYIILNIQYVGTFMVNMVMDGNGNGHGVMKMRFVGSSTTTTVPSYFVPYNSSRTNIYIHNITHIHTHSYIYIHIHTIHTQYITHT